MKPKNYTLRNFMIILFFVFVPALLGYFIFLNDPNDEKIKWWVYFVISLVFIIYVLIINFIFIFFQFTNLNLLSLSIPLTLMFVFIFISASWSIWVRLALVTISIIFAYPMNIFVTYIARRWNK